MPGVGGKRGKAFRQGPNGKEEALAVIEGPKGIALAVFVDGPPQEIHGLTNKALLAINSSEQIAPAPETRRGGKRKGSNDGVESPPCKVLGSRFMRARNRNLCS